MRELSVIKRVKQVYQLKDFAEFQKGEWLKNLPDSEFLEISYKANNHILVVNDMTPKSVKEYMEEKENGKHD